MDEQLQLQIDQYINNEMTAEEQAAFEQAMANDPELAAEVMLQQDIETAFQEPDVVALRQKIEQVVEDNRPTKVRNLHFIRPLAIAASILVLLAVGYFLIDSSGGTRTPEELYLAYATLPDNLRANRTVRSLDSDTSQSAIALTVALEAIEVQYQSGAYQDAMKTLQQLGQDRPEVLTNYPSTYHYFEGIIYLGLQQFENAITALDKVENSNYKEKAEWYRTMASLKTTGFNEKIRETLLVFTRYDNPYQTAAQEILNELENK